MSISWSGVGVTKSWSGVTDWSMGISDWSGNGMHGSDWGSNYLFSDDSLSLFLDNSVESIDGISSISNNSDGSIRFDEGILSLDNISVSGFGVRVLVSGQTISNGISEVVLWVGIIRFWLNGMNFGNRLGVSDGRLCVSNGWGSSEGWSSIMGCYWGNSSGICWLSISNWPRSIGSSISDGSSSVGNSQQSGERDNLEHFVKFCKQTKS
jgi:hypothetical protein